MNNFYEKEWTALEEEVNRRGGDGKTAADALRDHYALFSDDAYEKFLNAVKRPGGGSPEISE